MTEETDLIVGAFYWVMPTLDPDRGEEWEYYCQPARFYGRNDSGVLLWQCIGMDDPTDWPMRWIGPRATSPMDDEDERVSKGNAPPDSL